MDGRTYSSYELDKFQTCPKLWDLSRRLELPEESWPVSLHLGACIAVGLAARRLGKDWRDLAFVELERRYEENDEWSLEGVFQHVEKGVNIGFSSNLGLKTIISADQQMYGRCRPDVVGRDHEGRLRVWDDKTKLKLDAKYIDEELNGYRHSNQLFEYAWEVGRYYNEPVYAVGVNLIVLSPSAKAYVYPIILAPEAVEYWAEGALDDFLDMEFIETGSMPARTRWTSCTTKYNKKGSFEKALCPMYPICHDLHGDESRAEALGYRRR